MLNHTDLIPAVISVIPTIPLKGVYYIGQYGTSGYAVAAKGYLYHYFTNGIPITWEPLRFDNSELSDDNVYNIVIKSLINKWVDQYDVVIMHCTPDLWPRYRKEKSKILSNKIVNGYCTWETNHLPEKWVECINNYVNEVWCPSTYNERAFKDSGVTIPIRVVPHIFLPQSLPLANSVKITDIKTGIQIGKDGRYIFYAIGELNIRKGIEDTIQAYCKAFKSSDPVRLILKVHYRNYSPENKNKCEEILMTEIEKYPSHPEIIYLLEPLSSNEMLGLHSIGDCYVSLTKAEGFGLTIFDAYNYGKKIIATGYSGHLDFLGTSHEGLVHYKLGPVKGMLSFSPNYTEDQMWAYPSLEHAIELMKKGTNV